MTKLAPEWVRTSDPVIRSPARYRWTTAPASLYLEGRMLDLRTDVGLWPTLNQWDAPPPRAGQRTESVPRGRAVSPELSAGKDAIAER